MRNKLLVVLAVFLVAGAWSSVGAWTLNFENGLGHNGEAIASGIPGLQFTTTDGLDWRYGDATTGSYNVRNQLGDTWGGANYWMGDYVFAWLGTTQGSGRIDFLNQDGSYFSTGYCSYSSFTLEAYDKDGNLITSATGGTNTYDHGGTGMNYLSVSSGSSNIAYVLMHDTGNYWCADNMSGDASGVPDQAEGAVPEPATLLLFGLGLVGGAIRKRMAK